MKKTTLFLGLAAFLAASSISTSCLKQGENSTTSDSTSVAAEKNLPPLKGDDAINRAARFYAGIAKDNSISMSSADQQAWDKYSKEIKQLLDISASTRSSCDSLVTKDFSDFRDKVDVVFYPFSGADFLYPTTIFPNADTYVLCGLEKTGTPIGTTIKTGAAQYESYRRALSTFLRTSYFITKDMKNDMNNDQLDGTCPVITMLMATAGYEIISIENMKVDSNGKLVTASGDGNVMKYKFFKTGSKHEQTLFYISADVANRFFDPDVKKFINNSLANHTVATYLKAASYLMHMPEFTDIRDYIVKVSQYVVEDDSGVPYRFLTPDFDITLYGTYKRPLPVFTDKCVQHDLDQVYKDNASQVRPLNFRIGYNNPSNWLCARRKSKK